VGCPIVFLIIIGFDSAGFTDRFKNLFNIEEDNLGNQVFTGWNNLNVSVDSAGDYRVYAKFEVGCEMIEDS